MSWRTFKFFELEDIKDPDNTNTFNSLLRRPVQTDISNCSTLCDSPAIQNCGVTCFTCGRGQMVLGDSQGEMHVLTSFSDLLSIKAYLLRVSFIYQMKQRNVIITVGDDEDLAPLIRVWNYEKMTKDGMPTLARSIPALIPNAGQSAVMALCAHENSDGS
jgi:hypothetical protein